MKNTWILCCLFAACCLPFVLTAQVEEIPEDELYHYHKQGSHSFNVGVGVPNLVATTFSAANLAGIDNDGGATPIFTIKYEYGLTEDIGAGIHLGYFTAKTPSLSDATNTITTYLNDLGLPITEDICNLLGPLCTTETTTETQEGGYDRYHVYTPGVRLAYHRKVMEKLDTYASVVGGYNVIKKKRAGSNDANLNAFGNIPTFAYFTAAGARYYFSPKVAIYGEVGYGTLSVVNFGLTYRM